MKTFEYEPLSRRANMIEMQEIVIKIHIPLVRSLISIDTITYVTSAYSIHVMSRVVFSYSAYF